MAFQRHEGFAILFTTDVMSEGLDLQSADCIINYDLPFNPQKIEQRIGRIDRIGQESENLTIVNMLVEEPLDQAIYEVLVERIRVFEKGLGDLPDTLIEKIETGSSLDKDEVIKTLRDNETRQKLLESDALLGLDDALDEEIEAISRTKRGGTSNLRWMAFERLMLLMLGEKHVQNAIFDTHSISFRGLDELDIKVLSRMVDIKERADVQEELQGTLTADGTLRVAFSKDSEGLYLPYFHPLMQRAVEVSYRSLFGNAAPSAIEPETLSIRGHLGEIAESTRYLLVTEFDFEGKTIQKRKWSWFSLGEENQELHELDKPTLEDIWAAYREGQITVTPAASNIQLPQRVLETIRRRHVAWIEETRAKDTAQYLLRTKADIQRYCEQMNRMRLRWQKNVDFVKSDKVSGYTRIKEHVDRLKGVVAEIESDSDHPHGIQEGLRLVAVFKFE